MGVAETEPLSDVLPVLDGDAPAVSDGVGDALVVLLPETVVLAVPEGVPVPVGVLAPVGVPEGERVAVALALSELLPVLEGVEPGLSDAVGEGLTVVLPLTVELGVFAAVPVPVPVPVPDGVPVGVGVAVLELLSDALPELDAEAPVVKEGVGEALTVLLADTVVLAVPEDVPVPVGVLAPVEVPVGDVVAVMLELKEMLPVLDADAPVVSEGVGEALTVLLADSVVLGVPGGVGVPVPEPLPVLVVVGVWLGEGVPESVGDVVALLLSELLPVLDADAPVVRDGVGEALTVELALRVLLADTEMLGVGVPVLVTEGVPVPDGVPVGVTLGVALLLNEILPVFEGEAPLLKDVVGVTLTVVLPDTVELGVSSAVPDPV